MFHLTDREQRDLKIILLQLRRPHSRFLTVVHGDLVQKGSLRASEVAEKIRQQCVTDVQRSGWKYASRARVSVRIHFRAKDDRAPALHNLVKFYLDPLCSTVFKDDRQVSHLSAQCYHPPKRFQSLDDKDAYAFIEVERLTDYKHRFDLYFELIRLDEIQEHLKSDSLHRHLVDEDDEIMNELMDEVLMDEVMYGIMVDTPIGFTDEITEYSRKFRARHAAQFQEHLLKMNRIEDLDRPGGAKSKYFRQSSAGLRDLQPFSVDLGSLPARGESGLYKQRIRAKLEELREGFNLLRELLVTVELDVQVMPRSVRLGKDLDNIMRDIAPIFEEVFLDDEAYLGGYRIYFVDKLPGDDSIGSIRLKLLPFGAIYDFEERMDETFKAAEDWIRDQLRHSHLW